jgi:hypothetical protein
MQAEREEENQDERQEEKVMKRMKEWKDEPQPNKMSHQTKQKNQK